MILEPRNDGYLCKPIIFDPPMSVDNSTTVYGPSNNSPQINKVEYRTTFTEINENINNDVYQEKMTYNYCNENEIYSC